MRKKRVDTRYVNRILNHGPTVLVTSSYRGRTSIITLAWTMPVSLVPPMLAIAVAPERYTHGLIAGSREFVVNVPSSRMLDAVWYCGTVSGRDEDKFRCGGLTPAPARVVGAPCIAECFAHIECRVVKAPRAGDHTIFVGEVVAASAQPGAFDRRLLLRGAHQTLHHLGGPRFFTSAGTKLEAE